MAAYKLQASHGTAHLKGPVAAASALSCGPVQCFSSLPKELVIRDTCAAPFDLRPGELTEVNLTL